MTTKPTTQIPTTLFWQMQSALIALDQLMLDLSDTWDSESRMGQNIASAHAEIGHLLGRMEPLVSSLKDIDTNAN